MNMEAAKNSQCADFENQLHISKHALDEKAAMLVKVKSQLEKVCWLYYLFVIGLYKENAYIHTVAFVSWRKNTLYVIYRNNSEFSAVVSVVITELL